MQNVDILYPLISLISFLKAGGERKKGNLMADSNHNQLYSSWDLYPGKEGRWAIYPCVLIQDPMLGGGKKKKRNTVPKKGKKARLNQRHPKMSYNQNTY